MRQIFLTPKLVEEHYGLKLKTLERWRKEGGGPVYRRVGKRMIFYAESDIVAFLDQRQFKSRAHELVAGEL